jgi:cell division protein ZapB
MVQRLCRSHAPASGTSPIAAAHRHTYSFAMSPTPPVAANTELVQLEQVVSELLALLAQLREENRALRQRQELLASERASLLQRNEQVRTRVEAMIGRLRNLEQAGP